jgi:hypothetical protein
VLVSILYTTNTRMHIDVKSLWDQLWYHNGHPHGIPKSNRFRNWISLGDSNVDSIAHCYWLRQCDCYDEWHGDGHHYNYWNVNCHPVPNCNDVPISYAFAYCSLYSSSSRLDARC